METPSSVGKRIRGSLDANEFSQWMRRPNAKPPSNSVPVHAFREQSEILNSSRLAYPADRMEWPWVYVVAGPSYTGQCHPAPDRMQIEIAYPVSRFGVCGPSLL